MKENNIIEFYCLKKDLKQHLNYVENIVSSKTTIPILNNVLIELMDNKLFLSATDLETYYKSHIDADVLKSGSITVNGKKLLEILKVFNADVLLFRLSDKNKIKIVDNNNICKTEFSIYFSSKNEFPDILSFPENKNILKIRQYDLKILISKVIYAASSNEIRHFLTGVLFEKIENKVNFVATDGKRLSYISHEIDNNDIKFSALISSKSLRVFLKILGDEELCEISISENRIFFKVNNIEFSSNILEGNFPDYKKVIPTKKDIYFTTDKFKLINSIKTVSALINAKTAQINFELNQNNLKLTGYDSDNGHSIDEIEVDYNGNTIKISLNYNYILDVLREIISDKICFYFNSSDSPVLIQGIEEDYYLSVIMPMKSQ